jgi:hypothetical protein
MAAVRRGMRALAAPVPTNGKGVCFTLGARAGNCALA